MQHQGAPNNNCIFTVFIFDVCWSKTSFSEKKIKIFFVTAAFKSILTCSYKVLFAYSEYHMNQKCLEKKKPNLSPPRRLIVDLWQFIIWDTTKSSPRISNPITIFLGMQRDHGKPFASVTIFWFLENLKLKDISVYYYLQRTSMSIKMSEEGEFKSWMCVH